MNWGKYIAITLLIFIVFICYFVVQVLLKGNEAVPYKYYLKDNEKQKEWEGIIRANRLKSKPNWVYDQSIRSWKIYSNSQICDSIEMDIEAPGTLMPFYRYKYVWVPDTLVIKDKNQQSGFRNIKFYWFVKGKEYFSKGRIYIP